MKKKIVRHSKAKKIKTNLPKKSLRNTFKWQLVFAAIALVTVGYLVFKNSVQKADINMIAPPAFEPATCGVSDLQLSVSCGENLYKSAIITCADQSSTTENTATSCRNAEAWYKEASIKCTNKCIATATPVASEISMPPVRPSLSPAPSGCTYQNVQCVKAPCDPVLVCAAQASIAPSPVPSSPVPSPEMCTQETGICVGKSTGSCITYTDGCQKSSLCATPFTACRQMQKK